MSKQPQAVKSRSSKSKARDTKAKPLYSTPLPKIAETDDVHGRELPELAFSLNDDWTIKASASVLKEEAEDSKAVGAPVIPHLVLNDPEHGVWLYHGNCLQVLDAIAAKHPEGRFDMIFADPPYFLSNGGITCHAGKMVKVDKGDWDKSRGPELNHEFNIEWLKRCKAVLKPNGTIWVSGTHHVIHSIGYAMQCLEFKLLNDITWEKPNPPPNLSCRYFTHSPETVIWAAKSEKSKHTFNYDLVRETNRGKQHASLTTPLLRRQN